MATILEALRTAKNDIQPLYEEYKGKNSDWVPGWWDFPVPAYVTDERQQEYWEQRTEEQHL